jgi:hypothetical protein
MESMCSGGRVKSFKIELLQAKLYPLQRCNLDIRQRDNKERWVGEMNKTVSRRL